MHAAAHVVARVQAHNALRAVLGRRKRLGRMPRQQPPLAIEAAYARDLVAIVNVTRPLFDRLIDRLPELLHGAHEARGIRQDEGETQRLRAVFDQAGKRLEGALRVGNLEDLARRHAHATSAFQRGQLARQVQAALGIDIATHDRRVPAMIDHFVHENVALVRKLGRTSLGDLETLVTRAFRTGGRAQSIAKEIAARYGVHERHARLIARDQIGSLNGAINEARQRELGLTEWRWRTVRDERVRPTHRALERQSEERPFSDTNPALEDGVPVVPGQPILCRCYREPVFDSLLETVAQAEPAPGSGILLLPPQQPPAPEPPAPEFTPEYLAERERMAQASAVAREVAQEELAAFAAHQQAQAAELAAKQAAQAAELAAQEAAKAAKKAATAEKARATRAANKAKREAQKVAEQAAAAAARPGEVRYAAIPEHHFHGFHGRGFVQDADAIEGGSVRVVRVKGADGDYFEAVFKVTTPYGDKARSYGSEQAHGWEFRRRKVSGGALEDLKQTEITPNAARIRRSASGGTVEIGTQGALANQVRIRAKSLGELDAQMAELSRHLGLELHKEPSRVDIELQTKAKLAAKFDPKAFGSLMTGVTSPEEQRAAIEHVFDAAAKQHPIMLDALADAEVREVYPGHKALYSESLGKHMAKQWGSMYHDGNPSADIAAKIVGDTGLMSSNRRYNGGVFVTGMSTSRDFETGGADGVFMRVAKESALKGSGGRFRAVIDTEQVMGRLDWWAFDHDNYGRAGYRDYQSRWSIPAQLAETRASGGNEVMAPHGVPPSAFKRFIVEDESYRQRVLDELRKMGVTKINGKPAEQFVTTR